MCGICGILDFKGTVDPAQVSTMVATLVHRGPDARGVYVDGPVGLGHTRLSIIDLSETGAQPMSAGDGAAVMTYNGELYNYRDLKRELEAEGVRFAGSSDSEVVLQAYLRWGPDVFRRFNGIFAVAIWDSRSDQLVLARDRFGVKPLYYHSDDDRTTFGSEIKALLASKNVDPALDYQALHEFLYFRSPLGDRTMFQGVRAVEPGSYMTINRHGTSSQRYWKPSTDLLAVGEDAKGRAKVLSDVLEPIARLGGGDYLVGGRVISIARPD